MSPAAQAVMDKACKEMEAAGERAGAYLAAQRAAAAPPLSMSEIFKAMNFVVIDCMPAGRGAVAGMAEIARIGITPTVFDRMLAEQAKR